MHLEHLSELEKAGAGRIGGSTSFIEGDSGITSYSGLLLAFVEEGEMGGGDGDLEGGGECIRVLAWEKEQPRDDVLHSFTSCLSIQGSLL